MTRRAVAALAVGLGFATAAACGNEGRGGRASDSAGASAPPPPTIAQTSPAPSPNPAGACPHDGRWRACSVAERLEQAGLAPRPDTAARPAVPFLAAPDTALRVALGTVRAFVYADTARLARDVAALDTVGVAPRGGSFDWPVRPTLVRSANLVAVVLVTNERQLERVQLALSAGPPPRNPDRP